MKQTNSTKYKLPQPTQYKGDYMNSSVTIKNTEILIVKLPWRNILAQIVSLENSTKHLKNYHKFYTVSSRNIRKGSCLVAKSRPTLCDPMDYSLPGSSAHGILQLRIWEWVAISFTKKGEKTSQFIFWS